LSGKGLHQIIVFKDILINGQLLTHGNEPFDCFLASQRGNQPRLHPVDKGLFSIRRPVFHMGSIEDPSLFHEVADNRGVRGEFRFYVGNPLAGDLNKSLSAAVQQIKGTSFQAEGLPVGGKDR